MSTKTGFTRRVLAGQFVYSIPGPKRCQFVYRFMPKNCNLGDPYPLKGIIGGSASAFAEARYGYTLTLSGGGPGPLRFWNEILVFYTRGF